MNRTILGLALSLACLLPHGHARAQTEGILLGAALNVAGLSVEDSDKTDTGVGISVAAGYSFGIAAPYARASITSMAAGGTGNSGDRYTLIHLDAGARISIPLGGLQTYLTGAYTVQFARFDVRGETAGYSGAGFTFGGGALFSLGDAALDAGLTVTTGEFTEADSAGETFDVELGTTTTRLDIGFTFSTGARTDP